MKLLILGPPSCTSEELIREALEAHDLKPTLIVVGEESEFHKTIHRLFSSATLTRLKKFKIDWKNCKRPGAVEKEGKYGKYNSKAGFHRDEDMIDFIKEEDGVVLIIEQNSDTDSIKKMVVKAGIEPLLFNCMKSENKEVLYRL